MAIIRVSTFADDKVVAAWDQALAELRDTRGLILDARRNGGGDTALARPMMGRLIKARTRTPICAVARAGPVGALAGFVEPRGPFTYRRRWWC